MKTTAFTKYHIAAGAKMAEFAGYNMPIEFTGINDEHMAVRNGAGVFDVSHMGEIWVKGPRALDLLQRITTNDVAKLYDGKVQYSCMPNGRGGIVDEAALAAALDRAAALLEGKGAWRIHGGGFAGCIQCLVPISGYEGFRAAMDGYYGEGACFELRIRGCGAYRIPEEE